MSAQEPTSIRELIEAEDRHARSSGHPPLWFALRLVEIRHGARLTKREATRLVLLRRSVRVSKSGGPTDGGPS
jgi:hypothetical protein